MPALETPPEEHSPELPSTASSRRARGDRGRRYQYFETHELITLLDEVDDERSRARFREAVYLALILWMGLFLLYLFLPRWLPHRPVLVLQQRNPNQLTYLDTPADLQKLLKNRPAPAISTHSTEAQTPRPTREPRAPEPRAGTPQPPAQRPQPQPRSQPRQQLPQAPQPQASAQPPQSSAQPPVQQTPAPPPQQQARNTPIPRPTAPLADSPGPQHQPVFNTGGSAGSQIASAARNSRSGTQDAGDYGNTGRGNSGQGKAGVQVLSDTQGVDFSRYLQRLLADVRRNWLPLIPEECNSPLFKQGVTGVRFTIQQDGTISAMHLDYSTHDVAIDRAAWGSIRSLGQTAPLPKEFHGPNLELRIEFRVNKDRDVE